MENLKPGDYISTPLLGASKIPTEDEHLSLEKAVKEMPVAVFQVLNRHFNKLGFMLSISKLKETKNDGN